MRLIDADRLMDSLRGNVLIDVTTELENEVSEQPTAFDKEKVIEELREEAISELGITGSEFNADEGEYSAYCSITFSNAKEIVEKGGIE